MFESRQIPRTITIHADDPRKVIDAMRERFGDIDLTNYYRRMNQDLEDLHDIYFQAETSPDGDPWPELSPFTVDTKGFDTILQDKGDLIESLTGSGHPDAIREIAIAGANQSLAFGTGREYAANHNEGHGVPRREHVGVTETTVDAIAEQLADHVLGVLIEGEL